MKTVSMLPNLLTLANAGCGLLAVSKAIDALAAGASAERFDRMLEASCWLIFLAGVLDALDGRIARLTDTFSDFGAQLDSFADAVTFGVAPAIVAKVLLEHESTVLHPRVNFLAAAAFSLMAILRLARFNLETEHDEESHRGFKGLPSPAAAGMVSAMVLMYLSLRGAIEVGEGGQATPVGRGLQFLPQWLKDGLLAVLLPTILVSLPLLGLLMVSRVRYPHVVAILFNNQRFPGLVKVVFVAGALYLAPVPMLFAVGLIYVVHGVVRHEMRRRRGHLGARDRKEAA